MREDAFRSNQNTSYSSSAWIRSIFCFWCRWSEHRVRRRSVCRFFYSLESAVCCSKWSSFSRRMMFEICLLIPFGTWSRSIIAARLWGSLLELERLSWLGCGRSRARGHRGREVLLQFTFDSENTWMNNDRTDKWNGNSWSEIIRNSISRHINFYSFIIFLSC